jgi:prevent-host-death family protein
VVVTATELKANIGRYLNAVSGEEVYITRNGKVVAKLTGPSQDKQAILDGLVGIAADNQAGLGEAKRERLSRQ